MVLCPPLFSFVLDKQFKATVFPRGLIDFWSPRDLQWSLILVLFCGISSDSKSFLLKIEHNTQSDTSAVLKVVEGLFYVTCKVSALFLCVLCASILFFFFLFSTVCCRKHHNTITCMVLILWNVIMPRSTSVELLPVFPSCLP